MFERVGLVLLALLLVLGLSIAFWGFLLWPWLRKQKELSEGDFRWRREMLQGLAVFFLFEVAVWIPSGQGWNLLGWLSPPLNFAHKLLLASHFSDFLAVPLSIAVVASITCLVVSRKLRYRAFLTVSGFCLALAISLPMWTRSLQDEDILHLKPDCYAQFSFWHSLAIAGEEFQFSTHVFARKAGKEYGWSFREMDFYEIPNSATPNIETCPRGGGG